MDNITEFVREHWY